MSTVKVDRSDLEAKVKDMYRQVALEPQGAFHFEMGRALAERLGYASADLDRIPAASIDSFAGVGYHFGLAALREGDVALDLGSGSGMDTFIAALKVGRTGSVVGLDMTDVPRSSACSEAWRPARTLRHRDRYSVAGRHRVQCNAVGRLHRRRDAAG